MIQVSMLPLFIFQLKYQSPAKAYPTPVIIYQELK